METTIGAVLDFGGGRMGVIDSSFSLPRAFFAEVVGERGRIVLPAPYTPGHAETVVRIEIWDETLERHFGGIDHYMLEVEGFSRGIRHGIAPFISLDDSLEQAESIERIYAAAGYTPPWLAAPTSVNTAAATVVLSRLTSPAQAGILRLRQVRQSLAAAAKSPWQGIRPHGGNLPVAVPSCRECGIQSVARCPSCRRPLCLDHFPREEHEPCATHPARCGGSLHLLYL